MTACRELKYLDRLACELMRRKKALNESVDDDDDAPSLYSVLLAPDVSVYTRDKR